MAGLAHDVLIQALRDDAFLLPMLLAKLTGRRLPGKLKAADSAVRSTRSAEVRPDLVYRAGRSWLVCEVQNKLDKTKARSWLLTTAALRFEHRRMGDLVVITASPAVARWAGKVAHERGSAGTTSHLTPVVLLLDGRRARELLDPERPELALCAAWAMKARHGRAAIRVVERAFELSENLPPSLRDAQRRAIFTVLSDRMRSRLREATMHPDRVPETPESRELRLLLESNGEKRGLAQGKTVGRTEGLAEGRTEGLAEGRTEGLAEGKRDTLRMILTERGLALTAAQRRRIDGCSEIPQLDAWLKRALTADTAAEVLGPASEAISGKTRAPRRGPAPSGSGRRARNGTHA